LKRIQSDTRGIIIDKMPPFGFDRKKQRQSFTTNIIDKEDLEEI
jgi:hypothetical protein